MTHSQVRQNFHKDCEDAINKHINLEFFSSYTYLCMAYYFQRDDVALRGFVEYFKHVSDDERAQARLLMDFLNSRGGRVVLKPIEAPGKQEWDSALEAMQDALDLEKRVNENLLQLHSIASGHMDVNFCDYLQANFLQQQVNCIKQLADNVTNLKRVGEGVGLVVYDNKLRQTSCNI